MDRRRFLAEASLAAAAPFARASSSLGQGSSGKPSLNISVAAGAATTAFPHYWETAAGSDRTVVGLREQWRQDLMRCRRDVGIQSIRCHGLFDDEMGIAANGRDFNFLYLDQVYDFMLDNGVKPFVELSFMPEAFASSANRIFAYKGNTSPPRVMADWLAMVTAFTEHCRKRYGAAEVRSWKFEVWNEPNIAFWSGTQNDYFELYKQTALALKKIDSSVQVGGPSTAQLGWIPDFLNYCSGAGAPVDFVTSHVYPNDPQAYIFGKDNAYSFEEVIPQGLALLQKQIKASKLPQVPLWITEWSSQNPAFIAHTLKSCMGLAEVLAYWTFSNVFEEGGVPRGVFNTNFGMLDQWGIARPSFNTFVLLHKLGSQQVQTGDGPVLATRRTDGTLAIMLWNLIPATAGNAANGNPFAATGGGTEAQGENITVSMTLAGLREGARATVSRVDGTTGTGVPAWRKMGSPQSPTKEEIATLRTASQLAAPTTQPVSRGGRMDVSIPANGVVLLEIK